MPIENRTIICKLMKPSLTMTRLSALVPGAPGQWPKSNIVILVGEPKQAMTNVILNALPSGTVTELLEPVVKGSLATVPTYHVMTSAFEMKSQGAIENGGGHATKKTVPGPELIFSLNGAHVHVMGTTGAHANNSTYDVLHTNDVIHGRAQIPNA